MEEDFLLTLLAGLFASLQRGPTLTSLISS
jgi:hypothetical protein